MNKKTVKRIIGKEGLIVLGLAIVLYLFILLLQNIPVALPRYKLEFADGGIYTININPEIRNNSDYKKLLKEIYNPSSQLINKRIKEFTKTTNIKSALKSFRCINTNQIRISELYSYLIGVLFIIKLAIMYLFLLLARFIVWAIKTQKEKE